MTAGTWVGRNLWIAVLVLVVGPISPTLAGDGPRDRESLAGLAGVHVLVEPMDADVEQEELAQSTLRTDVEVKLRQAGIRVLTMTESALAPGSPYLYLRVSMLRVPEMPLYAVNIHLELDQRVMLARNPTIALLAPTWSTASTGVAGMNKLDWLRERVRDQVDRFINAYLAANPKR